MVKVMSLGFLFIRSSSRFTSLILQFKKVVYSTLNKISKGTELSLTAFGLNFLIPLFLMNFENARLLSFSIDMSSSDCFITVFGFITAVVDLADCIVSFTILVTSDCDGLYFL